MQQIFLTFEKGYDLFAIHLEVFGGKGSAGVGFEKFFKFGRFFTGTKCNGGFDFPGPMF